MIHLLLVIVLIVFGVLLLLAELFLLPGFGIAGICGFVSLFAAVVLSYITLTPLYAYAGHLTLAAVVVLSGVAVYAFIKSHAIEKMALDTTIDGTMPLADAGKKIENLKKEAEKLEQEADKDKVTSKEQPNKYIENQLNY